jgi:universal stress protein E
MAELNRILVGIDLLQSRQGDYSPPVKEAIKQAIGLAERLSAEVTFFAAIELAEEDHLYSLNFDRSQIVGYVEASAEEALAKLVEEAAGRGVRATRKVAVGRGWVELTREAIAGDYDLVVVGTRNLGPLRRVLFGSTATKLLHNCPRPVWVAKPEPLPTPRNLLVASDFSDASNGALRWAVRIASSNGATVHLIHVLERPYIDLWEAGLFDVPEKPNYAQHRAIVEGRLQAQLSQVGQAAATGIQSSIIEYPSVADAGILKYIGDHQIDLLLLGTSGRCGIAGFFLGNTAERLLTGLTCSLLAVKPPDFVCPAHLERY